jgi:ATP-dependent protease HslVU (ClpYQ) peptidase subunit
MCGDWAWYKPMIEALEDDELDLPEAPDAFTAIVMEKDGKVRTYDGKGGWLNVDAPYAAFGSGSEYAIGALDMGATAETAVRIASGRDLQTGGVIQVERPGLPKIRKRTK